MAKEGGRVAVTGDDLTYGRQTVGVERLLVAAVLQLLTLVAAGDRRRRRRRR
jgi:hypothetical protein